MIYLKRNIWLTTFGIFITAAILVGGFQILKAEGPPYYCPHPYSYLENYDCLGHCSKSEITACILSGYTYKCCEIEGSGGEEWDCGCFVE